MENPDIIPSKPSGFYDESFKLTLSAPHGYDIFYTLDCSMPTCQSQKYEKFIDIEDATGRDNCFINKIENLGNDLSVVDKAVIVRAALFTKYGQKTGEEFVFTYFLCNVDRYSEIPFVSLIFEPDDLFDKDTGIYVTGTLYRQYIDGDYAANIQANYTLRGQVMERPCHMTYFNEHKERALSQNFRARIRGGYTRKDPQKGFNLYADAPFDNIFGIGEGTADMESIALMSDYGDRTKIRIQLGVEGARGLCFGALDVKPCNLFVNGEYWGLYFISERYDENYFKNHYGIDADDLIMIKRRAGEGESVEIGMPEDISIYNEMLMYVRKHDMSEEQSFRSFMQMVDVDSLLDYYCYECCIGNQDWPENNYALWRSRTVAEIPFQDGKWRFLLYDTNEECSTWNSRRCAWNIYEYLYKDELITYLLQNQDFRSRFATRICDLVNTRVERYYLEDMADSLANEIEKSYLADVELFHRDYDYKDIQENIKTNMGDFMYLRRDILLEQTKAALNIEEETVSLIVVEPEGLEGYVVTVNGIPVDLSYGSWQGIYFADMSIELGIEKEGDGMALSQADGGSVGWEIVGGDGRLLPSEITVKLGKKGLVIQMTAY